MHPHLCLALYRVQRFWDHAFAEKFFGIEYTLDFLQAWGYAPWSKVETFECKQSLRTIGLEDFPLKFVHLQETHCRESVYLRD